MSDKSANLPLWEVFIRSKNGLAHGHVGSVHATDAEINSSANVHGRDVLVASQDATVRALRNGPRRDMRRPENIQGHHTVHRVRCGTRQKDDGVVSVPKDAHALPVRRGKQAHGENPVVQSEKLNQSSAPNIPFLSVRLSNQPKTA